MDSEKQSCSERAAQPQTNDFTLSMRGVGGGVATEGQVLKWPLIPLSLFTIPQPAGVQSGHMGTIQNRSVPQEETKDTTCMLMHCEAFREGNTAEAEGWSVLLLWRRPRAVNGRAGQKLISAPLFLTNRKRRNKKCATLWGRGCYKIDFLLLEGCKRETIIAMGMSNYGMVPRREERAVKFISNLCVK